jgi:opacity protein-like surface antigen
MKTKIIAASIALFFSQVSYALLATNAYYIALDAGTFQGSFNQEYTDKTDIIAQNISESVLQNGYTEGLSIGYQRLVNNIYLVGAELSANLDSHKASFQSGASTTAFSDNAEIKNHFDLVFVPGMMLNESWEAYAKIGISYAFLQDTLTSPIGFIPTITSFNSTPNTLGFASGLGIKKFFTDTLFMFAEGDYHDYGSVTFSDFQNFSANYTHTAYVNSYSVVLGAGIRIT